MLSLIVIAKNEAAGIETFLDHHRPLGDEVIVVDTGSEDNTAALATAAGALVSTFSWCDDFAAARNFSLDQVQYPWVLCLDVDEFIDPADFAKIQGVLSRPAAAYMMPQRNYYEDPQHPEWQPVTGEYPAREQAFAGFFSAQQYRLFPTGLGLRWQGRVHEDLAASVRQAGLPRQLLEVPIHHYGYVKGEDHNRQRNALYGRLVLQKIADEPDNPSARLEWAMILIQEGRGRESIPLLAEIHATGGTSQTVCRARTMLAKLYVEDGHSEQAVEVLHDTVRQAPEWIFGWTDFIHLLISRELWEPAEAALDAAGEVCGEDPRLLKLRTQLLIQTKRIVEAISTARRVQTLIPGATEYGRIADRCETLAKREGLI